MEFDLNSPRKYEIVIMRACAVTVALKAAECSSSFNSICVKDFLRFHRYIELLYTSSPCQRFELSCPAHRQQIQKNSTSLTHRGFD